MRIPSPSPRSIAGLVLVTTLAACGSGTSPPAPSPTPTPSPSPAAAPAPAPDAAQAAAAPSDEAMRAECRTRAAGQYGMPETAMKVDSPVGPGGAGVAFAVPGYVDKGAEGTKTFLCRYAADRKLIDVMATTPDGE